MFQPRFLRSAAIALGIYGAFGLLIGCAMLVVGYATFNQVIMLQQTLESERAAMVRSIRSASGTVHDTAVASSDFRRSIDTAQGAANQASKLANDSAGTFRQMGSTLTAVNVLGIQPLAALGPQFDRSADQLQQLAITLGSTRDALGQNGADIGRVSGDLDLLQTQLDNVDASLSQPGVLSLGSQSLLPFQIAFYGMCLLVVVQSAFSIIAGLALDRALKGPPPVPRASAVSLQSADQLRDIS
jgi:hypothetical protein